jgi:hypothetical protein
MATSCLCAVTPPPSAAVARREWRLGKGPLKLPRGMRAGHCSWPRPIARGAALDYEDCKKTLCFNHQWRLAPSSPMTRWSNSCSRNALAAATSATSPSKLAKRIVPLLAPLPARDKATGTDWSGCKRCGLVRPPHG